MHNKAQRARVLALLLGVIFLGAQFHFCTDLSPSVNATHMCPICSVAGTAVATQSPSVAIIPVSNRLEVASPLLTVSSPFERAVSPRAPPSL